MSDRRQEDRVREVFAALREEAAAAPPFREVWERAARGRGTRARRWRPVLAAAAALAMVSVSVLLLRDARPWVPRPAADPVELARALSSWEAPLDFLLAGPEDELYGVPKRRRSLLGALPDPVGLPGARVPEASEARGAPGAQSTPSAPIDPAATVHPEREETT